MAKWWKIKERGNVEDRRGSRMWVAAWGIGVTGLLVVLAIGMIGWQEPAMEVLNTLQQNQQTYQQEPAESWEFAGEDEYEVFASTVLGSNDALWKNAFSQGGKKYSAPKLVLFRGGTQSACGWASSKMWPHYCPTDQTIYLDETFFDELTKQYGAKWWDVAEAYVIAHEVAHHIQNQLGISQKVQRLRRTDPNKVNQASVHLELQADCLAGIWAASIAGKWILEVNEISEAIDAAEAVGDDRIQEAAYWEIHPETWTHGSSADRKKWFNIGYKYSSFEKCDTFK